jgi:hypothetical protein
MMQPYEPDNNQQPSTPEVDLLAQVHELRAKSRDQSEQSSALSQRIQILVAQLNSRPRSPAETSGGRHSNSNSN